MSNSLEAGVGPGSERSPSPRWELLRALGALSATSPRLSKPISEALGLGEWSPAEHTRLFVLDLPPYCSIYLGPEGKLGGEGADRVAGFWRALGLEAPASPDHLACLLALYAELGQAAQTCRRAEVRRRLDHARSALLGEHLVPWLPSYLAAAASYPAGTAWARLMLSALEQEVALTNLPSDMLPIALRDAGAPIEETISYSDLLEALTTPVRAGFILTASDLEQAGRQTRVGVRRGERRFALDAMLAQDPPGVLSWLSRHARRWATLHLRPSSGAAGYWWHQRSKATADVLGRLCQRLRSGCEDARERFGQTVPESACGDKRIDSRHRSGELF